MGVGAAPSVVVVPSSSDETEGEAEAKRGNLERHPDAEVAETEAEVERVKEAEDPDRPRVDLDGVPLAVNNVRGSGEPTCSYRQRVSVHSYFYEEGEWSANGLLSRMTHDLLERIRREYDVPKDVIFALPQEDDRPNPPLRSWVTLYWEMFKNEL